MGKIDVKKIEATMPQLGEELSNLLGFEVKMNAEINHGVIFLVSDPLPLEGVAKFMFSEITVGGVGAINEDAIPSHPIIRFFPDFHYNHIGGGSNGARLGSLQDNIEKSHVLELLEDVNSELKWVIFNW